MSWPARSDHGPSCPHPVIRAYTSSGVPVTQLVGTETEPFRHPRPEALHEYICLGREPTHDLDSFIGLEVDRYRSTATSVDIALHRLWSRAGCKVDSVHDDDVRPQVGEHHGAERRRPESRDLDDADTGQWPAHHAPPSRPPAASQRPRTSFISSLLYVSSWRCHRLSPA